jgi:hypothetical protein
MLDRPQQPLVVASGLRGPFRRVEMAQRAGAT